eukprot:TRINITY_DN63293_c0_g1_i1.p1 TRINITY_DN63293_c0_g1~~TRINITY_DN63293_c0_g1_i1.p1  ORF type:complete len:340 (-),score=28.70 TRINITY_DN63293_c0_g1_i1:23-895(-)
MYAFAMNARIFSPVVRSCRRFGSYSFPAYKELQLTEKGSGVIMLELNRPERLHALSETMGAEIMDFCQWAEHSVPAVRAVVVTGAVSKTGKRAFSTGRDLKLSADHKLESEKQFYLARALDSVLTLKRFQIPTIAAVIGPAFGWGAELSLACDIQLFARDATICFPETSLGLFPGAAGAVLLPRLVPPAVAKEMIYTASRYSGEQVASLGLGRAVDDPLSEALAVAAKIARNAPLGVRGAKAVLEASLDGDWSGALELSRQLRPPLTNTSDFQEGLASFAEKRAPVFEGK